MKRNRVSLSLSSLSDILSFLIVVVAALDFVLLINMDMSAADPYEIYIRHSSTIAALLVLAFFFSSYYGFHSGKTNHHYMHSLKRASFFLFIAGIVKVIISGYYLAFCLANHNLVLLFYLGEILVWAMVSIFAFLYYKRLSKRK